MRQHGIKSANSFQALIVVSFYTLLLLPAISYPSGANAQGNGGGNANNVNIVLECVEFIGNGTYRARFGYSRPGNSPLTIPQSNSVLLTANANGNASNAGHGANAFQPGNHSSVFTATFQAGQFLTWRITLPNGMQKTVTASANSSLCSNSLNPNILPYYPPPAGGKQFNLIGSELTSLSQTFAASGSASSDSIFQINGTKVLIEVTVIQGQYNQALNLLVNQFGMTGLLPNGASQLLITGYLPIANLQALNNYPNIINRVVVV